MERLWAPWRMEYIESARGEQDGCLFCDLLTEEDEDAFILKRTVKAFAVMNVYPYNPGHLLVATLRHTGALEDLDPDEIAHTGKLLQESVDVVQAEMQPDGFNIGLNLGRVAGAGVPDHIHWHVVPRWNGDTNFMSTVGQTRLLPELVEETYRKLRPRFRR